MTLFTSPELITQITLLPIQELNVDAAILFSDILMIPKALGFHLHFDDQKGPIFDNPLKKHQELAKYSSKDILENLKFLRPAICELKKQLLVPLIGFAGAPFTLACYLMNHQGTKALAYEDPASFEKIIQMLEEGIIIALKEQIDAGCDAVQLFDTWANILTEEHFQKWCLSPLKRIAKTLKDTPLIYFCRGSSYFAKFIEKTDISAIHIDWLRPIDQIRKKFPLIPLQGNLDPEALFMPSSDLVKKTRQILSSMHGDPAYIFNLGHGILPDTPYHNVKTLVETVVSYK